ncbi:MAG TPA: hypothetical protein VN457_02640, partial [Chlamydiales bacterium]|nr:hypothetical protein [Chlamydiales bacterium]
FFRKVEATIFTEEPTALVAACKELNEEYVSVKKTEDAKTHWRLERISTHILNALHAFTQNKYDFTLEDLQTLQGLIMKLPQKVCDSDPLAWEMQELFFREMERKILFDDPSKEDLQLIYKIVKELKIRDESLKWLDYLLEAGNYTVENTTIDLKFSPNFPDLLSTKSAEYSQNAANFMSENYSSAVTSKVQAEATLTDKATGKWVLWSAQDTGQGYVSVKTATGCTHHSLAGVKPGNPKSGNWVMYHACGALVTKQIIGVADAILCC